MQSPASSITRRINISILYGSSEKLQGMCSFPTLSGYWKAWTDHPMELTWFQIAVPSYSFKYNSDRSNQMLTLTNRFYSDSIKNHGIERKYSSSSSIPGSINYTSIITKQKYSSSSSGIATMRNLCLACGYIENLQFTCRCPTLSRD